MSAAHFRQCRDRGATLLQKGNRMGGFEIDAEAVRTLASLLDETGLGEIEYAVDEHRIRVAKLGIAAAASAPIAVNGVPAVNGASHPADADAAIKAAGAVPSPMVGTVYFQASPGDPPFIKTGDRVAQGDVIAIIEAMKVMNQIPAPRAGVVTSIDVANAQAVEFGETLLVIE